MEKEQTPDRSQAKACAFTFLSLHVHTAEQLFFECYKNVFVAATNMGSTPTRLGMEMWRRDENGDNAED